MARILLTIGVVLVLIVGLAAAVGVLAYGTDPPREGTLEVPGLAAPVRVGWDEAGRTWIEGPDERAIAAGLGYTHAADHGWAASLWRQAANGTLAEWFGADAHALDLHARTLGFASLGRRTYEALPVADRDILDAYARGASAGFAQAGVAQSDAFIVADVVPTAWEPWDALAVERLHAYLAAPALSVDPDWQRAARLDTVVARFIEADSTFRAFLGMPGGGFDRAYTARTTDGPALIQQVSAGSSALAFLTPTVLRTDGRTTVALTIPGTLVAPGGWAEGTGWGMLLGSALRIEPYGGAAPPLLYSRIVERDGDETLLAVARDSSGLVLRPGRAPGDSLAARADTLGTGWRVRWPGFALGTDLASFRALQRGQIPSRFLLFDGAGLAATATEARLLGSPRVAMSNGTVSLVAQDTLARYAARLLARPPEPDSGDVQIRATTPADREVTSAWARDLLPALLARLGARDSLADVLQVPFAYLNGWDGAYRTDGIAPSVFEWWLASHRDLTGHLPDPADSLDVALLPWSLRIARAELRDRYGPRPTDWRWGRLQGNPQYPVLGRITSPAARRFRDGLGAPAGHPTTLRPGPSLVFEEARVGLATWTLRTDLRTGRVAVRSPALRPHMSEGAHLDAEVVDTALLIDPSAPMPPSFLLLTPVSS